MLISSINKKEEVCVENQKNFSIRENLKARPIQVGKTHG